MSRLKNIIRNAKIVARLRGSMTAAPAVIDEFQDDDTRNDIKVAAVNGIPAFIEQMNRLLDKIDEVAE